MLASAGGDRVELVHVATPEKQGAAGIIGAFGVQKGMRKVADFSDGEVCGQGKSCAHARGGSAHRARLLPTLLSHLCRELAQPSKWASSRRPAELATQASYSMPTTRRESSMARSGPWGGVGCAGESPLATPISLPPTIEQALVMS